MTLSQGSHCVYETHYHIVFPVKYRKALLNPDVVAYIGIIVKGIEERYPILFESL